jgi:hypothetical protein
MRGQLLLKALAISIAIILLFGCNSGPPGPHNGFVNVTIDLNKIAPIGYEICADHPPKLSGGNVDLMLRMPQRLEIPPDQQHLGAKYVEFRPGRHEVSVYRDLHSARLLYTEADLAMEEGVPTIRVKLEMAKLSKGRYVLGISGNPFFTYCTVDLQ